MKIRNGFVSNSSSSSFICGITGEIFQGYDADPQNFGLISCTWDHTFLQTEYKIDLTTVPLDELKELILEYYKNDEHYVLKILCSDYNKYSKIIIYP